MFEYIKSRLCEYSEHDVIVAIQQALTTIRNYTQKSFITKINLKQKEVEIKNNFVYVNLTKENFVVGDHIELFGSDNNISIYSIREITEAYFEVNETLIDEVVNVTVIKLRFNELSYSDVLSFVHHDVSGGSLRDNIQSENMNGYSYSKKTNNGFLTNFNHLRKNSSIREEYVRYGYVKPLVERHYQI